MPCRDMYLHSFTMKTCQELDRKPEKGDFVYAQFPVDKKWYRARVEEADSQVVEIT